LAVICGEEFFIFFGEETLPSAKILKKIFEDFIWRYDKIIFGQIFLPPPSLKLFFYPTAMIV